MKKIYLVMHGYMRESKGIAEVIFASEFKDEAEKVLQQKVETTSEFYMLYETPLETYLPDQDHWPGIEFDKQDFA
ncbi:hypothetical protein [Weissella confusa]